MTRLIDADALMQKIETYLPTFSINPNKIVELVEDAHGECFLVSKPYRKEGKPDLIVKFANEIKTYCKLKNTCYGCPFFDEEVAYEDACRLNDRPMFWKEGDKNGH